MFYEHSNADGCSALKLCQVRESILAELVEIAKEFHSELSGNGESLRIEYSWNAELAKEGDYLALLDRNRKRDSFLQSTGKGPHRDDYNILLNDLSAADLASEGQQRSISLSLALAIIAFWRRRFGFLPVALADDALGELDSQRSDRFWSILDDDLQLIATGTRLPATSDSNEWKTIEVKNGRFET